MLSGVLAPMVTPFDARDGALARAPFERNVRAHLAAGLAGVLVSGSSGEAALLDEDERVQLVEWARALVPGDRWLMAGIGGESTRVVVQRARAAAAAGADAVLVVSPHYYSRRMSDAALHAHFAAVADASPVPVLLYNIPVYAHLVLSGELVARLAEHANIVGMKDSAGDLPMLDRYLAASGAHFRVLTGSAQTVQTALERGAAGAILAVALFAAERAVALYDAVRAGDAARAAHEQAHLLPMAREIVAALGPAGLKAAMDLVGLDGGPTRAPLLPVDDAERARVEAALAEGGVAVGARSATRAAGERPSLTATR